MVDANALRKPIMTIEDGDIARLEQVPVLRERVHLSLEQLIITGRLAPGLRLVETDLAERLGVSRGPIREALQQLAKDGFVDLLPRQGAFVHTPTDAEIDDFFDVRVALEAEAARLASVKAPDEAKAAVQKRLDDGIAMLEAGEDPAGQSIGADLHQAIAIATSNDFLRDILALMNKRARWYTIPFEPERRRRAWDEHVTIVEAIVDGDPERASNLMTEHIRGSREAYKAHGAAIEV